MFLLCGTNQFPLFFSFTIKCSGGRHRADPGRSPSPIVVSVDVLRERYPYDGGCDLPFRPNTNGLRYVGKNYRPTVFLLPFFNWKDHYFASTDM